MNHESRAFRAPLDAVVFGAGPAGCAAAIALRQCGRSVTILERASRPAFKAGEHLRPEALGELDRLGLPAAGRDSYLQESPGIRVVWGSPELRERDYLFDHRGAGWNVSRRELESMLIRCAGDSGATVMQGASQLKLCRQPDAWWRIDASVEGKEVCLHARWLLDATGRRAWVARHMGARREHVDRLVALVGQLHPTRAIPSTDRLLVEAAPDGWWYSVSLPDGSLTVAYLTDSDILPGPDRDASRIWADALAQTEQTRFRTLGTTLAGPISAHGAQSAFLTPMWGSGWIALGDAAWSSDPLAGIGVSEAVQSGCSAARAVDSACAGDEGRLVAAHAEALDARIDTVLTQVLDTYRQELRWADRPFWNRRHVAPDRITPITLLPDSLVRLRPSSRHQPALGIAPEHFATLLTLAPTPRPAANVLREFTARCPVDATAALRALQALAEVIDQEITTEDAEEIQRKTLSKTNSSVLSLGPQW